MASYCNIGDIARVTLPYGSVRDFKDTPITISCEPQYPECSGATVYFYYSEFNGYSLKENVYGFQRVLLPFYEIRINPDDDTILEAYCRGKTSCQSLGWHLLARRRYGGYFTSLQFDKHLSVAWKKANRIYQSAANIVNSVNSMIDSVRNVNEFIAENTGRIGNALKKFQVVSPNAFKWIP